MTLNNLNFASNTEDHIYRNLTIRDSYYIRSMVSIKSRDMLWSYESLGTSNLYFTITNFLRVSKSI